jgi:hypothetical protein
MSQLSDVLNEYNMTNEDIEKIEEVLSNPQYHLDLAEKLRALRVEKKFTKAQDKLLNEASGSIRRLIRENEKLRYALVCDGDTAIQIMQELGV